MTEINPVFNREALLFLALNKPREIWITPGSCWEWRIICGASKGEPGLVLAAVKCPWSGGEYFLSELDRRLIEPCAIRTHTKYGRKDD